MSAAMIVQIITLALGASPIMSEALEESRRNSIKIFITSYKY